MQANNAVPTVKRRLICIVYESLLLLAVEMFAIAVYLLVTFAAHSPVLDAGRGIFVILVAAAYFIYSWTGSGHTLAMKTWRIKIASAGAGRISLRAAATRFILAWGFVAPALVIIHVSQLLTTRAGISMAVAILVGNIVLWSLTALLDKDRQFLHDRMAGTRLLQLPKPEKKAAKAA
ncbi:RDD family protein [Pseudoduganella sp. R-34]|uniref:RDD family protein n=1 Tax=unclassified Pseudoduganella TaxID=2637179 RepID=UPI003CFB1330